MSRPALLLTLARVALALLVLAAIGWQLRLHLAASYSALNFFSYFTNLSNLFAAGVLLVAARSYSGRAGEVGRHDLVRYLAVVNMLVVGLVFALLLRNVDLGALRPWINTLLHEVMPVAMLVDWLLVPPRTALGGRHVAIALLFPAGYLVYVLIRGAVTGWYPYPFLDPAKVDGYGAVGLYVVGIAAAFVLVGWALLAIGNRRLASRVRAGAH